MEGGDDITRFTIDWANCRVTCPQGQSSTAWLPHQDHYGNPLITVKFSRSACRTCPARRLCTKADVVARPLTWRPEAEHTTLHAARRAQQTPEWKAASAARSGAEATLSQAIGACELRQAHSIGQAKNHLQHVLTATINVGRVYDHL